MAIDFPNSPTTNQIYSVGNRTWVYDGSAWVLRSASASAGSITSSELAANSVTSAKIVDDTIVNADINSSAGIVLSKLENSTSLGLGVGTLELGHATDTTLARGAAGVVTIEGANVVTVSSTDTMTNKTLTAPTVTDGTLTDTIVKGLEERFNVVAAAATGTINIDVATSSVWFYTSNATANHTLNFRYNSGTTLNSKLAVGDAITIVWMNQNGATPYYPNVIQIDGSAVTPKVPSAISSGNASSIDVYSFTIVKTAATPTYQVLETQTKFA